MNHDEDYPADYLAGILKEVKTIAMVGASSDPTKFSYGVLRVLHETGYDMVPVNPKEAGTAWRSAFGHANPRRHSKRLPSGYGCLCLQTWVGAAWLGERCPARSLRVYRARFFF